jgi:hypothetical protein
MGLPQLRRHEKMKVLTAYSSQQSVDSVIAELMAQFENTSPKAVIYFASTIYDQQALASQMQTQFPNAKLFGCSTAGEIVSGKMLKQSVVAMAIGEEVLEDVAVEVVMDIAASMHVPEAFKQFEAYYGEPISDMDTEKYVGIIMADGLSGAEERLMGKLSDLTDVTFIGGSAGDDLQFKTTYVYADGKVFENAAVLVLLKLKNGFDIIKTQSFRVLNQKLTATEVNEANREVIEFDGMPAIEAYARALGVSVEEASNRFMTNPLGLMAGTEPYVRSPQKVDGSAMVFFCNIIKGMELAILEATDMIKDTLEAVESKALGESNAAGIINFHCILRTLQLEGEGKCDAYGEVFSSVPTIGFSTYGEEYIGHVNQTSTMLVLK